MATTTSACGPTDLAGYFSLPARSVLHPGADEYTLGFGDAAFRTAAAVSNGHLIPRSLTLSFSVPDADEQRDCDPASYLRSLMMALRRVTELFDEDREVMHIVLGEGLPEYLGIRNLGNLLDAVPRYLRTTAVADVAVTLPVGGWMEPLQLAAAGCTRCTLVDRSGRSPHDADTGIGYSMAAAGFHATGYRLSDCPPAAGDAHWLARLEHALAWQPDRIVLPWAGQPCGAIAAARVVQAVSVLEQHGYRAGGGDTWVKPCDALAVRGQYGAHYCDLHGMPRAERTDMLGIGVSAISQIGDVYCRVTTDYSRWSSSLDNGRMGIERGLILSEAEKVRAEMMQALACDHALDTVAMAARHEALFTECMDGVMPRLQRVHDDGLAYWEGQTLCLTPLGKLLWRAVADCFRHPDFSVPTYP